MIDWILTAQPSGKKAGGVYWSEGICNTGLAIYKIDEVYSVKLITNSSTLAGPFDTFEAACAAYTMIKQG